MLMLISYITCFAIYLATQQCINFYFRWNISSFMTENNSSRFFQDAWYISRNSLRASRSLVIKYITECAVHITEYKHTDYTLSQTAWSVYWLTGRPVRFSAVMTETVTSSRGRLSAGWRLISREEGSENSATGAPPPGEGEEGAPRLRYYWPAMRPGLVAFKGRVFAVQEARQETKWEPARR